MFLNIIFAYRLGDEGGQAVCKALLKNTTLKELDIGSNDLGEPTAALLSKVLRIHDFFKNLLGFAFVFDDH